MTELLADGLSLVECSLSGRKWQLRACDDTQATAMARELDIPDMLARILLARGIGIEDALDFLSPSLKAFLPDPSSLKDMDAAAERIASAVIGNETIAIFGDYDVDGATSSALLMRFLCDAGSNPIVYIPDRIKEGYGPNTAAMLRLKENGAGLIITVDCGTLAFEPLEAAHEAGIDVVVVDHHIGEARRPKAFAVVNPNRFDENSPLKQLAAVGVAFLLAVAVNRHLRAASHYVTRKEPDLLSLLDLVALGTVCDVVPLTGLNRAYVAQGLKVMANRGNLGLRTLMDVARIDERPSTYHAGFILGPRVNAGGRVGKADLGARLLCTENEDEAQLFAKALDQYNDERKAIEAMVLEEALEAAAKMADEPVIMVAGEGWHPGVIGIVAGRLKESYNKPVAVVALADGIGKASARSVPGFDFGAAVIAARDLGMLLAGGGHAMAAGFTLEEKHLADMQKFLCLRVQQSGKNLDAPRALMIDGCVAPAGANAELALMLERAAPFGQGNPNPRIMVRDVTVVAADVVGENHVRLVLSGEGKKRLHAIAFRALPATFGSELLALVGKRVHVAGHLRLKIWQGQEQLSLTLDDVAMA